MTELHDMVLRKSRSLAAAERQMDEERAAFATVFQSRVLTFVEADSNKFLGEAQARMRDWATVRRKSILGVQVTLTPHYDLGIPRLESLSGLYPAKDAIRVLETDRMKPTAWIDYWVSDPAFEQKILGGMSSTHVNDRKTQIVEVKRDGRVTVTFIHVRHESECTLFASYLAAALGVAVGVFDRLRERSSHPAAAADLTVDVRTVRDVGVGVYEEYGSAAQYGKIAPHVAFPIYTIGDTRDFPALFHEVLGDLMNLANKRAADLQPLEWSDPR